MLFRKKKKVYIYDYGNNKISLSIEYPNIEKEENEDLLFEFIKKYSNTNYFIVQLFTGYNDELANIEEYKSMEKSFIQKGCKFDYIVNNNYRWQLLLLLIKSKELDICFFKEIIKLYCGGVFFINLNKNDYNQLLNSYNNKKVKSRMYDHLTLDTTEDYLEIMVNDVDKYPKLLEAVYKLEEELHKDSL